MFPNSGVPLSLGITAAVINKINTNKINLNEINISKISLNKINKHKQ